MNSYGGHTRKAIFKTLKKKLSNLLDTDTSYVLSHSINLVSIDLDTRSSEVPHTVQGETKKGSSHGPQ